MKTRIRILFLCVVSLLITLGVTPQTCKATPVTIVYGENANLFGLAFTSGPINVNSAPFFVAVGNWLVTVNALEVAGAGAVSDSLVFDATARHIVGPHGEGPNAGGFAFNFTALNPPPGVVVVNFLAIIPHGPHFDQFLGTFTFTAILAGGRVDITGYSLVMIGVHTLTNEPIPEPATLLLLGTGLLGMAARARKRRKIPKSAG